MADQPVNQNTSDEIDLRQLFQMIRRGFNRLGILFLRLFLYLKKNAIILISLVIGGALLGYGLKLITTDKMQIDVIVRPNLESKDYLYNVVGEIEASLRTENESFFKEMGIQMDDLKAFEISIEPVKDDSKKTTDKELEYLEILQKFENTALISDILRAEVLKNTEINHRITFTYKSAVGKEIAEKLIDYINSNDYFEELISVKTMNSTERIEKNGALIAQIDTLIESYSNNMNKGESSEIGKIVLDNGEKLDVRALLDLKNSLIRDIEIKRMELKEQVAPISIINFGKPHQVTKAFFGKKIILIPIILLSLFFLLSILRYLNKKASEIEAKQIH